jgi:hypothetical protein
MAFEHTEVTDCKATIAFELAAVAGLQAAIPFGEYAVAKLGSVVIAWGSKAAAEMEKATLCLGKET